MKRDSDGNVLYIYVTSYFPLDMRYHILLKIKD